MIKKIIGLSATVGDIIYWGNRKTKDVTENVIRTIRISGDTPHDYDYFTQDNELICSEKDFERTQNLLGDYVFCTNEALRDAYMKKEKIGD